MKRFETNLHHYPFSAAKVLFEDSEENPFFVALPGTQLAYSRLQNALKNPFKIILMSGRPGAGKSYLLHRFQREYAGEYPVFLFSTPIFDDAGALKSVYRQTLGKEADEAWGRHEVIEACRREFEKPALILLDEAQLYSEEILEWIRLLSNERVFKFIIVVHRIEKEDILAREHFKTRTFETIEVRGATADELRHYLQEKFRLEGMEEVFALFGSSSFRRIHRYTKGNLREINRMMVRLLELLDELQEKKPGAIKTTVSNRYIDMVGMDLGMGK